MGRLSILHYLHWCCVSLRQLWHLPDHHLHSGNKLANLIWLILTVLISNPCLLHGYLELLPHILTSSASVFRFYDSFQKKELTWNHLLPLPQFNIYLWWAVASFLSSLALVNNLPPSLPPSQLSNHLSLFSQILLLISLSNTSAVVWVSFLSPVFVKPWQTSYNRVQHVPHLLY